MRLRNWRRPERNSESITSIMFAFAYAGMAVYTFEEAGVVELVEVCAQPNGLRCSPCFQPRERHTYHMEISKGSRGDYTICNCIQDLHQVCVQLLHGPKAGMAVSPRSHAILDTATSCRLLSILSGPPILQIRQIFTCYGIEDFCCIHIALFVYHFMGRRDLVWSHELYVISIFMMPSY